jgi:hypothetical protein
MRSPAPGGCALDGRIRIGRAALAAVGALPAEAAAPR